MQSIQNVLRYKIYTHVYKYIINTNKYIYIRIKNHNLEIYFVLLSICWQAKKQIGIFKGTKLPIKFHSTSDDCLGCNLISKVPDETF